jgi:hypothetical protein
MENVLKAFTKAAPFIDGGLSRRHPTKAGSATRRLAPSDSTARQIEWTILRRSQVNGLVVGSADLTAAAMAAVNKHASEPVVWWGPDRADIPEVAAGTLIINDVDRLDEVQQDRLTRWIVTHCPGVQVLALARTPIFAKVVKGRFSAALYYRINTVVVEMHAPADLP